MADGKQATTNGKSDDEVKRTKHRSPNYPAIGLRKAVERAKELYDKHKRHDVPVAVAHKLWGYKANSGLANQVVGAMKAFGLIEVDGEGDGRKVRLSDRGCRIILGSNDSVGLLRQSAVMPAIYKELWKKFEPKGGIPDDDLLRHHLVWDRTEGTFNPEYVDNFIAIFKDSLRYAGMQVAGIIPKAETTPENEIEEQDHSPEVGDLVQWTSAGVDQFAEPRAVVGFSDDGQWVFVDGTSTGLPMDQLTVVIPKMETLVQPPLAANPLPPSNPFFGRSSGTDDKKYEVPTLTFPLPRGNVIEIRLKSKVTAKEFDKIKALIDLSESSFVEDSESSGGG